MAASPTEAPTTDPAPDAPTDSPKAPAISTAQDRLTRGVRQLGSVSASGIRTAQARYAAVAADSSVRRLLTAEPAQRGDVRRGRCHPPLCQPGEIALGPLAGVGQQGAPPGQHGGSV